MKIKITDIKNRKTFVEVCRKLISMESKPFSQFKINKEIEEIRDYWNRTGPFSEVLFNTESFSVICFRTKSDTNSCFTITPDEYLFGVKPGDKFMYVGEEVEYIGYDFDDDADPVWLKDNSSHVESSDDDINYYYKQVTNCPEINTKIRWTDWNDLEPVEEKVIEEDIKLFDPFLDAWVSEEKSEEIRKALNDSNVGEASEMVIDFKKGITTIRGKLRENPYYYKDYIPPVEQNKAEEKTMLQELTNTLKRHLKKDIQKQYRAGIRDGGLRLTDVGYDELIHILADEYSDKLTERAEEIIKEHKDK